MPVGTVKFFNADKGYGFIQPEDGGKDVFVHASALERSGVPALNEGDKVKVTLRFRGRELSHQQLGMNLLKRVQEDTAEDAKIEAYPRMEGRQMLMVLSPK